MIGIKLDWLKHTHSAQSIVL